ncbi:multiubiquitin domain-containing protein [Chitinophaga ginsengisegetis]|uniref:multiubiquitin domain-containing protein n=1 Tax=Chitinophaga ginsengisegetis TaxID=393003 RepID=UPI0009A647F1|nr:multiubiquitin domain-containing protein [Chitinophaga ginsengisegetis]
MNPLTKAETCGRVLSFNVEDKPYSTEKQYLTGAEIKQKAGLSKDTELFLTISAPWKDDPISDDEQVDLARPGIEGFYIKKKLKFTLDCKDYETDRQYITGTELRKLGKIPADYEIYLSISGPYEDELISDDVRVNLARPGIENFYSCKPNTTNG